jgi:metallo-beta-lactamase class B
MLRIALLTLTVALGFVQQDDSLQPFPPFKIAGNLYYVGSHGLASYLITTPQGHILINSDLEASVPLLRASVEKLGFQFTDVKVLLISHAHFDHDAGSAAVKRMTGAKYMVMDGDVPVVESGGKLDFFYGTSPSGLYPPAKVDRVLHDGDSVTLGGSTLIAHLTPGHTKGCTTWTMKTTEDGKSYNVVILGSIGVNPGYVLVNNKDYPQIADDYVRGFKTLRSLPCDVFLASHGRFYDMQAKYAKLQKGGGPNPFIDPAGYKAHLDLQEKNFRAKLEEQQKGSK